jgi:hypothetical protein
MRSSGLTRLVIIVASFAAVGSACGGRTSQLGYGGGPGDGGSSMAGSASVGGTPGVAGTSISGGYATGGASGIAGSGVAGYPGPGGYPASGGYAGIGGYAFGGSFGMGGYAVGGSMGVGGSGGLCSAPTDCPAGFLCWVDQRRCVPCPPTLDCIGPQLCTPLQPFCQEGEVGTCGIDGRTTTDLIPCGADQYCQSPSLGCQTCPGSTRDCNRLDQDGCESEVLKDPDNCGKCGNSCAAGQTCVKGLCEQGTLYTFSGVANDVPISALSGWTECHRSDYAGGIQTTAQVLQACNLANLLLGCRLKGETKLRVAAHGPRKDVVFDVGNGAQAVHVANGVGWYFSNNYSWGFVVAGDSLSRGECDVESTPRPNSRLCWHTVETRNGPWGYRCGSVTDLNEDHAYERLIFEAP